MENDLQNILTLLMIIQFIFGNLSNGFIVLINCIDWVNKRKSSLVDQILIVLAISRIILIWEVLVSWFSTIYHPFLLMKEIEVRIITFSWIFANHFSLWFATILAIFYLLKIASFSRSIFLYLKWRVKKVILMMLLGNLIILILNLIQINIYIEDWIYGNERNTTWNSRMSDFATFSDLVTFNMTLFSTPPFTVALIAFLLLIFSLWQHLQNMQHNFKGPKDPRTSAHITALKIMISFLLLYAIYFLSLFILWLLKMQNKLVHILILNFGFIYPSSHSFILIWGNFKLRKPFILVLAAEVWAKR
ncbi:LOW QUALITY PROTEIN: taste receptor type 2 member 13-like [Sciurus carolinensis]|uniref:LOW QUALITY PROTEIN: taste receptor type 2 member 13-like n=1 Tax=Sciurus carolinensis TaxID=30640 RepID=UPI001FB5199F|nr:LOW QUALITY PROTEIN: taste receptor type 2 member 13-like [Sciurus carolinensis]